MSLTPGDPPGAYEVVVHRGRRRAWVAHARGASATLGRECRGGLVRLAAYLRTPEGRQTAGRAARGVAVVAVAVGGVVVLRGWLDTLSRGAAAFGRGAGAVAGGVRAVFGAMGATVRGVRTVLSLRWLGALGRWLLLLGRRRTRAQEPTRGHVACPDCGSRVRGDAHVCHRCGFRPAGAGTLSSASRRPAGAVRTLLRLTWRAAGLRAWQSCPDCRRRMPAGARVCRSCGHRLAPVATGGNATGRE